MLNSELCPEGLTEGEAKVAIEACNNDELEAAQRLATEPGRDLHFQSFHKRTTHFVLPGIRFPQICQGHAGGTGVGEATSYEVCSRVNWGGEGARLAIL